MVRCGAGWPDQEGVKKNTANHYDGEDLNQGTLLKGNWECPPQCIRYAGNWSNLNYLYKVKRLHL